jgi:hypothetical protein
MHELRPAVPPDLGSRQVLFRILFRLLFFATFAIFGSQGFGRTLATFLALSTLYCTITGTLRREPMLDRSLTHWDEGTVYAVLGYVVWKLV